MPVFACKPKLFPVDRVRTYRRNWNKISPARKEELRLNLLVVFGMTPLLFYFALLPLFIPDTAISDLSAVLVGTLLPVLGLATRIKFREIRNFALVIGFVGLLLSALSLVQSKMETAFKVLSRDVTTLDFKLAGMVFAAAVTFTAIGLIHDRYTGEEPQTDPRRYM